MLTYHLAKGKILREKINGKFVYSVCAEAPAASVANEPEQETEAPTQADAAKPVEQIVSEIPAFTERHVTGQVCRLSVLSPAKSAALRASWRT
jgi:hypothetical protein